MFYVGKEADFRLRVSGLEDFLEYLQEIERVVNKRRIEVEKMGDGIPEEEQEAFWSYHIDEFDKYDSVFPDILQKSIFTSLFAYFEHQLMEFCEDKEKLKSIRGFGLNKAKDYLSKHLGYNDLFSGEEWKTIKKYSKVRNCLVHAGGLIYLMSGENEQIEIRGFIEASNGIEISESLEIELTYVFCEEFVNKAFEFLKMVFDKIEKAP